VIKRARATTIAAFRHVFTAVPANAQRRILLIDRSAAVVAPRRIDNQRDAEGSHDQTQEPDDEQGRFLVGLSLEQQE
jgi:hypothetical protein